MPCAAHPSLGQQDTQASASIVVSQSPSVALPVSAKPALPEPSPLSGFDCARVDEMPTPRCSASLPEESLPSELREGKGGGPDGVAWNPTFLECAVKVTRTCDGEASLSLRLGQHLVSELPLMPGKAVTCRFGVDEASLAAGADTTLSSGPFAPVFTPVLFRAELTELCGDPPYPERSHDVFASGYAGGE